MPLEAEARIYSNHILPKCYLLDIYFEESFNIKEKNPSAISLKELHLNLCVSLLMADLLMLLGLDATNHATVCTIVACSLHFLFLSVFGWILAEGARTYDQVQNVRNYLYLNELIPGFGALIL